MTRTPPSGWDRWARVYPALERVALGTALQRTREEVARMAASAGELASRPPADTQSGTRWLLLGDGDGRGLSALLARLPQATFLSVDQSAAMLARSRRRVGEGPDRHRVTWRQADLLEEPALERGPLAEEPTVDGVITAFFLDCFTQPQLAALWPRIASLVRPGGSWIVADFTPPGSRFQTRWRALRQRLLLPSLYAAFRATTPMTARALPAMDAPFQEAGWRQEDHLRLAGELTFVTRWTSPHRP